MTQALINNLQILSDKQFNLADKMPKNTGMDFGKIFETKTGDVTYDGDEHKFNVPLTQEETFSLMGEAIIEYQARVKFNDGSVNGTVIQEGFVQRSLSKEVL